MDSAMIDLLARLEEEWPTYGLRRHTITLVDEIYRIMT